MYPNQYGTNPPAPQSSVLPPSAQQPNYAYPAAPSPYPQAYPQQSYPQQSYAAPAYPQSYPQTGYPQAAPAPAPYPSYPQTGYPQAYPQAAPAPAYGYPQAAPAYPQAAPAYPQTGYPQAYPQTTGYAQPYPGYAAPAQTGYYPATGGVQTPYGVKTFYEFQLRGINFASRDFFSKSDPFLVLSSTTKDPYEWKMKKMKKDKSYGKAAYNKFAVYKSETVNNNNNPSWKTFTVDAQLLCNNNIDQPFLVEVFDWDRSGNHDLIGKCTTTLREMTVLKELNLIHPTKKRNPLNRPGLVAVDKCARVG